MAQVGFIRSKREIKFLILYITERLIAPVPFEGLQELTMCDPAIDFFEFSECTSYLVDTGHLSCSADGLYAITEKGVQNGRACVEEIPYSVRLTADRLIEDYNQRIRRQRQVQASVAARDNGTYNVTLCFNEDSGVPMWRLELVVPSEDKANKLVKRFQKDAEGLYGELISLLFGQDEKGS